MSRKSRFAGAILLTGFFLASQAHAYHYWTCGGVKVVWSNSFEMVQNTYSIAPGGARELAADKAIKRWQNVDGMWNMVSKSSTVTTGSSIAQFNFQNDLAVVPLSSLGGAIGLTMMFHDGCFFGGDAEWIEADVVAASTLDFGAVEETALPGNSGREVFIHEFGHAQGLNHTQGFDLMRAGTPLPLVAGPGETIDVLPDDAQGGRFLYPTGNDEVNLFASAHRRTSDDKITTNNSGTVTFCKKGGGTLKVNATVGNNGTVDVQQTERWWVSTSKTAHSGGIKVGQWNNGTFLANKVKTRELEFTMPALEPGTYFLYHGVDVLKEVDESREDDNNVREALVVQVNNC
ncbi:MAG TPA: hypothetical protein VKM72_19230 [Thermoanaerobaculia bacterium]|nr:hypothetical protein [Thermoanaerobaculia bacterium]